MAYTTVKQLFTAICDAIRSRDETTDPIAHQDIPARILAIPAGEENWDEFEEEMQQADGYVRIIVNGPAFGWFVTWESTDSWLQVDWGDGTPEMTYTSTDTGGLSGVIEHTFTTEGKHLVRVRDDKYNSTGNTFLKLRGNSNISTTASEYQEYVNGYGDTIEYIANGMKARNNTLLRFYGTSVRKLWTCQIHRGPGLRYSPRLTTVVRDPAETSGTIWESMLPGCPALSEFEFPRKFVGTTAIANNALSNAAFRELDFSNAQGMTSVGNSAFENCTSLETVIYPDTLVTLGNSAHSKNFALKKVRLPEGPTTRSFVVPSSGFSYCRSLQHITIPANTDTISTNAFRGSGLNDLLITTNNGNIILLGAYAFVDTPIEAGTGCIYVPDNMVSSYQSGTGWSKYASQIHGWSEVPADSLSYSDLIERGLI